MCSKTDARGRAQGQEGSEDRLDLVELDAVESPGLGFRELLDLRDGLRAYEQGADGRRAKHPGDRKLGQRPGPRVRPAAKGCCEGDVVLVEARQEVRWSLSSNSRSGSRPSARRPRPSGLYAMKLIPYAVVNGRISSSTPNWKTSLSALRSSRP
jgi:hypothetical protein